MWLAAIQAGPVWHHDGHFMGQHWAAWLLWILLAALLVVILWRLLAGGGGSRRGGERGEAPEEILRRRFSEGEIDEDGFRRRMRALQESADSEPGSPPEG